MSSRPRRWYVLKEGWTKSEPEGPYTFDQLVELMASTSIKPKTQCCQEGTQQWTEACNIPSLMAQAQRELKLTHDQAEAEKQEKKAAKQAQRDAARQVAEAHTARVEAEREAEAIAAEKEAHRKESLQDAATGRFDEKIHAEIKRCRKYLGTINANVTALAVFILIWFIFFLLSMAGCLVNVLDVLGS